MIRILNTNGMALVDIPTDHALHAKVSRRLDNVNVGDRLTVNETAFDVVARATVFHAGTQTIGKRSVSWSDERTLITVTPARRRIGSRAARFSITVGG